MADYETLANALISQEITARRKQEKEKANLLSDPAKLDKYVANVFKQVSPSTKVATSKKSPTKVGQVDYYIDKSHPMSGFGEELQTRLKSELAKPSNAGYSASDITKGITQYMLEQTDKKTGMSRLEKAYEIQRLNQTSIGILGFGGEDKTMKAPLGMEGMLTYDQWRKARFEREKELTNLEKNQEGYIESVNAAAEIGAGFGAATAFAAGQLGPQIAAPEEIVTVPVGAATGAIIAGGSELIAYPLRKMLEKTEWGSARKYSSRLRDRVKVWATEFIPEAAVMGGAEKRLLSSMGYAHDMTKLAVASPTAKNFTLAKEAETFAKAERKDIVKKATKIEKESPVIKQLTEEERALAFANGELTADSVIIKPVKKKVSERSIEEASKAVGREWLGRTEAIGTAKTGKQAYKEIYKGVSSDIDTSGLRRTPSIYPQLNSAETIKQLEEALGTKAVKGSKAIYPDESTNTVIRKLERLAVEENEESISLSRTARKALEPIKRETQEEALGTAYEKKSIDDAIDYFGTGGPRFTEKQLTEQVEKDFGEKAVKSETTKQLETTYNEIGDYHDSLLMKYYPDLELNSTSAKMQKKVSNAVRDLPKKATKEEMNTLTSMVKKWEGLGGEATKADVKKASSEVAKDIKDVTHKEAMKLGKDIANKERTGAITKVEAVQQFEDLLTRVEASTDMLSTDRMELHGNISQILTGLKKQSSIIKGLALFGVGAGIFEIFNADTAEANPWNAAKGLVEVAAETGLKKTEGLLMKELIENSKIVPTITENTVFNIEKKGFQTILADSAAGGPSMVLRNSAKYVREGNFGLAKVLSPGQTMNVIFNLEEGVMNNPAIFKVSAYMAENINTKNGLRVISNILKRAEVKNEVKEIIKATDQLTPFMRGQVGYDYYVKRRGDLTQQLRKLYSAPKRTKYVEEAIKNTKQQLAIAKKNIDKFKPEVDAYHKAFNEVAEPLARTYKDTRIFLAADDNVKTFSKYPFMKQIYETMSQSEKLAVGRLKNQMAVYRQRLEDIGVETKSGDYMHYVLHPKVNASMMEELTGDIGAAPYLKNYSRSLNSRPLVPSTWASMNHYIPDIEKRIQTQSFWDSGWRRVWNKLKHIEPVNDAFTALEKGTSPFERTWGNTAARWYTNIEVFKRLFGLPSAALKHTFKMARNMANLGVGATAKALPPSVKGVSWRVMENTPFLKKISKEYFANNATEYARFKKHLFDSVVPTFDTRWRMNQMGFGDYDRYFSKFAQLTDKINHVGGLWITMAENVDRGVSMEAGLRMAAKKGMTADQALYGIYDTILTNNFLGREFSPRWLRNPKFQALLLFQNNPYKIFESRLTTAIRAKRSIDFMGKAIRKATQTAEGREKLLKDIRNIWKDMKGTEQELKSNLFLNAARRDVDFYGNSAVKKFARDIIVMGAGTAIGTSAGVNLFHHFFHLPFIKRNYYQEESTDLTISISPGIQAIWDGSVAYVNRDYNDDEFPTTKIIKEWMGPSGPLPDVVRKLQRINEGDIPEIYQDDKFKYLFAIPASGEH